MSKAPTRDEAVTTGWQLVPVELTKEMLRASPSTATCDPDRWRSAMWAAMLASAPAPASGGVDAVREALDDYHSAYSDYRMSPDDSWERGFASQKMEEAYDKAKALFRALTSAPAPEDRAAWRDVISERRRQIEAEGWTPEHDDEHGNGEMAQAAASYALEHAAWNYTETPSSRLMEAARSVWPWGSEWWKPGAGRRMLVKAAALILAEIERLDRKEGRR